MQRLFNVFGFFKSIEKWNIFWGIVKMQEFKWNK